MPVIETEQVGHVRTIRMNRPEVKNALSDELAWGLVRAVAEAAEDDATWVLCVTGTGDAFCSGLDLRNVGGGHSPLTAQSQQLDDLSWISRFLLGMRLDCDKPIVAGINGVAVGGGLAIAMAADIRIAARRARLIAGYPRIGASPDGGLTVTLPQAVGYEKAMRFLLENRTVSADEALALGLVGEVVDDDAFAARLAEYCESLARISPITGRLTKRGIVRATTLPDLESQLRLEVANLLRCFASDDHKEARTAFLERRTPTFVGR